jgi:hypothetical protein
MSSGGIVPCFDPASGASGGDAGGGGGGSIVTPPSPTSEAVASGGSLTAKTFAAFTDPGGRIDASKYLATTTTASGSTSWSGTGLGPYTASGSADGDAGTLSLTARDSSLNPLATAVHSYERSTVAGASWVQTLNIDLTALSSTTLAAGSQTVGGVTIDCEVANETVGGGAGLTGTATKYSYVDVSAGFTGEHPRIVEIKITNAAWGGTGTGHAVRGRFFCDTAGSGPAAQTRYYPNSGNMRFQAQWQHRYAGTSGSFSTSGGSYDHSVDGAVQTWYSYIAMVRGTYYVWISKTVDVPTSLDDLLTPDANTWTLGINAYSVLGTAAYFPATALAGIYNQNAGSAGVIENVRTLEYK